MALSYDERACSRRAGGSSSRCSPSRRASPPRCRRSASFFPCSRTRSAGAVARCPWRCRSASSWAAWPRSSSAGSPTAAGRAACSRPPWRWAMALAIVLSGFNLGWLTAGPLAAWLIGRFGWRAAYVALGALIAVVGVPASLCVSYPQSAEARHVTAGTVARWPAGDRRLWYFVGAWGFLVFVYMMVTVHSVAYARDRGVPLEQASLALTAFGVGAIVGRLVAGAAADHFGVRTTMRVCLVIQAAALVAFVAGLPAWAVPATLVVFGLGGAGADNTIVKAVPDAFGVAALATIMSVVGLGWRSGAGLGPALAGFVYDLTGSYAPSFAFGLVAIVAGWRFFRLGSATL